MSILSFAQAVAAEAAPRWIPVVERLPECGPDGHSADVLILTEDRRVTFGWVLWDEGSPSWCDANGSELEHNVAGWQPLPPAPTEEQS